MKSLEMKLALAILPSLDFSIGNIEKRKRNVSSRRNLEKYLCFPFFLLLVGAVLLITEGEHYLFAKFFGNLH